MKRKCCIRLWSYLRYERLNVNFLVLFLPQPNFYYLLSNISWALWRYESYLWGKSRRFIANTREKNFIDSINLLDIYLTFSHNRHSLTPLQRISPPRSWTSCQRQSRVPHHFDTIAHQASVSNTRGESNRLVQSRDYIEDDQKVSKENL